MIYEPETVKGFRDSLPPQSVKKNQVRKIIEERFRLYGFLPMETPSIEYDELMRSDTLGKEDEAVSDRFRLQDRGGRKLGLRYEFTFQLSRIFKQNPNIKLPFRRYQIGSVFRDEPTRPGRFREFTQCDVDIIGSKSIRSDAECLNLVSDIMKELQIKDYVIEVNNRALMSSILESVKIKSKDEALKELDKIGKIGEDEVKARLRKYAETNQILTLFKLLEKPLSFFTKNLFDGAKDLEKLMKLLKNFEVKTLYNPMMIRGLGYYTGNVFEVKSKDAKDTIAAGGRYDNVVGRYLKREIPSVGISFGLERILELAKVDDVITKVVIVSLSRDRESIKLADSLRKKRVSCLVYYGQPSKALDYANSYKIPFTVFVGEDEVASKKYRLKDMTSGEEKLLSSAQVISQLKR